MFIRQITDEDRDILFEMMRVFYDSPALIHKSTDRVLKKDIDACLSDNPLVEAFIFEEGDGCEEKENPEAFRKDSDGASYGREDSVIGYAMVSKNFTTEYGGLCIWVEDLYFREKARGKGLASEFFDFIEKRYPEAVRFKLEVEQENERAVSCYKKNGYAISEYFLMTKEIDKD